MAEKRGWLAQLVPQWWIPVLILTALGFVILLLLVILTGWIWPGQLLERQWVQVPAASIGGMVDCTLPKRIPFQEPARMDCIFSPSPGTSITNSAPFQLVISVPENQPHLYLLHLNDSEAPKRSISLSFSAGASQKRELQIIQTGMLRGIFFSPQRIYFRFPKTNADGELETVTGPVDLETSDMANLRALVQTNISPSAPLFLIVPAAFAAAKYLLEYQERKRAERQQIEIQAIEKLNAAKTAFSKLSAPNFDSTRELDSLWNDLNTLQDSINPTEWQYIQHLFNLVKNNKPYHPQIISAISGAGDSWPDAAAGALIFYYRENKNKLNPLDKCLLRDTLMAVSGCSPEMQDAIIRTVRDFGGQNPSRETRWPTNASEGRWQYLPNHENKPNPFPALRAEEDHRLFSIDTHSELKQPLFWNGHSLYTALRSEDERGIWIITGPTGTGKTAMAMALGQYHYDDKFTLSVRLARPIEEETICRQLFSTFGKFLIANPSYGMYLHAQLLAHVASCLNYYTPNFALQVDDRLFESGEAVIQTKEEDRKAIIWEEHVLTHRLRQTLLRVEKDARRADALEVLATAINKVKLCRIRLVLDSDTPPTETETHVLERLVDTSESLALPIQVMVFLPTIPASQWKHSEGWKQMKLYWTPKQLEQMVSHRIQIAWGNPEAEATINEWQDLLQASLTPRDFIQRWRHTIMGEGHG